MPGRDPLLPGQEESGQAPRFKANSAIHLPHALPVGDESDVTDRKIRLAQWSRPSTSSLQSLARLIRANPMHRKPIPELLTPPPGPERSTTNPQITMSLADA